MLGPVAVAGLAILVVLWLAVGVWATFAGFRRADQAEDAIDEARRLGALVETAPALPMVVGRDGRIEGVPRIADWLGLKRLPRYLADLDSGETGLEADSAEALSRQVAITLKSAAAFAMPLSVRGSDRRLLVRGAPATPEIAGSGAVVLWLFDATASEQEITRLGAEGARLSRAFAALSALIEAAPVPMWHRGADLAISLVNTAYVHAVEGRDAQDVIERGLELIEPSGGVSPLAAAAQARDEGQMLVRTAPATIAGERRMLRIVDVPLGAAGVAGYAVDVEELEEARADLARFARAQRDMLDRLSAGVAQFGPDRALVFFNQPFQRLFAMKPEWLAEHPEFDRVLERMREAGRIPESRDFPSWKAERRRWFLADNAPIEENWLLPGGLHLRVVAQPLPDGGLLLIFEDRTEQIQLASARDTLLRVRTATFDNLFEAVGVFAADGRIHLWNNRFREVWGLEEELLARHPRVDSLVETVARKLANPQHASLIRELVRIATVERKQRSGRVTLTDGRFFEFAAVPLPDGNALFTMLDVSDSRRIEAALRERTEALEEANRIKTAFVANMSYELRTPLTSISGFAEMLAGGYAGPIDGTAKEYVGAILESVDRLSGLIDDVLDLTQSDAGALVLEKDNVALGPLMREAVANKREAALRQGVDLVLEADILVGTIIGDQRRLRQAIDHLLKNAIEHTPSGGRVLVMASGTAERAELVVSDNGEGMDAKERARAFDRFHRSQKGEGKALGLGLPLTRQFIEAHGGTVALDSEPGMGTTVTLRLPRERA